MRRMIPQVDRGTFMRYGLLESVSGWDFLSFRKPSLIRMKMGVVVAWEGASEPSSSRWLNNHYTSPLYVIILTEKPPWSILIKVQERKLTVSHNAFRACIPVNPIPVIFVTSSNRRLWLTCIPSGSRLEDWIGVSIYFLKIPHFSISQMLNRWVGCVSPTWILSMFK